MLPKIVQINWENGDVQKASPVGENNETYFFDVRKDACYWAYKALCEIIEW
jgi:hypothetical protein